MHSKKCTSLANVFYNGILNKLDCGKGLLWISELRIKFITVENK